jgi:hypothetical protein
MEVKFANYPFVTDEEIEQLVQNKTTLPQLENSLRMEQRRFTHYQNSPFFPANSDKHKAQLDFMDRLVKRLKRAIEEHKEKS